MATSDNNFLVTNAYFYLSKIGNGQIKCHTIPGNDILRQTDRKSQDLHRLALCVMSLVAIDTRSVRSAVETVLVMQLLVHSLFSSIPCPPLFPLLVHSLSIPCPHPFPVFVLIFVLSQSSSFFPYLIFARSSSFPCPRPFPIVVISIYSFFPCHSNFPVLVLFLFSFFPCPRSFPHWERSGSTSVTVIVWLDLDLIGWR